ncbi:MAG: alpha/beta fold hydrolase, partial [Gemmatimonadota bacterium]
EDGRVAEAERGLMFLPESRTSGGDDVVAVEFHRFRATSAAAAGATPIFDLWGGPGNGGLGSNLDNEGFYERWIEPFTRHADLVVVGQRGFDASRPYLRCGESERPIFDDRLPEEERMEAVAAASAECRSFWEERGVALDGFNVREAAADVAAVARVLGYDRIALFGNSFGSHWAMAVMRYHRELVARAVIGGVEGPDNTYDMPGDVYAAMSRIAEDAEQSAELRDHVPEGGLLAALEAVVDRLRNEPATVEVEDEESGETRTVTVDNFIAHSVTEDGYSSTADGQHPMAAWPADIIEMYHGDYEGLAREALDEEIEGYDYIPSAAYFLYDCASGISRARRGRLDHPAASVIGRDNWLYEGACPEWGVDLGEEFRTGFRTDVPTVIVQGTWDTSTPLENVLELLPRFSDVRFIPVERGTHGALYMSFRDGASEEVERLGEALLRFAATGETGTLPDSLVLPPVEWERPDDRLAGGTR